MWLNLLRPFQSILSPCAIEIGINIDTGEVSCNRRPNSEQEGNIVCTTIRKLCSFSYLEDLGLKALDDLRESAKAGSVPKLVTFTAQHQNICRINHYFRLHRGDLGQIQHKLIGLLMLYAGGSIFYINQTSTGIITGQTDLRRIDYGFKIMKLKTNMKIEHYNTKSIQKRLEKKQ